MVKTCIITGFGINADCELEEAFKLSGSLVDRIHISDLLDKPAFIQDYHILAFPGGFSYGDHLGSGLVFAHLFKKTMKDEINMFIAQKKLIIGICNGFQVLVKMGLLPNEDLSWEPRVSLIHNESGVFQDEWVELQCNPQSPCLWTKGLDSMDIPIRHGEGRFYVDDLAVLESLKAQGLIAMQYKGENPNGSLENIAGICDKSGQVFGLMPHPEAFLFVENHPLWMRKQISEAYGLRIFTNAVKYINESFDN